MSASLAPELIARAAGFASRSAIMAAEGTFTYADLLDASARVAGALLAGRTDLEGARICFHVKPSFAHVAVQWGIWRAGGIAVPMALSHPAPELDYVIADAEAACVIVEGDGTVPCREVALARGVRVLAARDAMRTPAPASLPRIASDRRAMMVYTSGTTGRPKGVVTTHANVSAQIGALVDAWGWQHNDRALLVLPLHHVHGIIALLGSALWSGAMLEMHPAFDAAATWASIASGRRSVFMAVPTIYHRLIAHWEAQGADEQRRLSEGCRAMRLMVSGSAALPVQMLERWREISGHTLLERYGMTEIGMAISNPLTGDRRPGYVGRPLPGVEARLVDESGRAVSDGHAGELEIRGANVFAEYWRRPDATREAFRDGWFRTGDTAIVERGDYRLLGRSSVDILKTGGYKVSALEIEEALRAHPAIAECAVVGIEDPAWGERISVAVEARSGVGLTIDELRAWAKDRLAPYKVPRDLRVVDALPRNAMGKVVKPEVVKLFGS